jgi:hypothetical protein
MVPVINHGESVVTDDHCVKYGATLFGVPEDEFYRRVCEMADAIGAKSRSQRPKE